MYIDTFFPDGVYHALLPRQTYASCWGGVGQGECRGSSNCKGLVYTNQCTDNKGDECCLQRRCTVPEGTGYCRDTNNQTCDGGTYFAGSAPSWPCPGISSIQCCVTYDNMNNGTSTTSSTSTSSTSPTSTSNSTSTTTTPSTSSPTTSATAPAAQSKQGLSGSQIGGIVGGVVGAVFLLGVIALFLFFRRRKKDGDVVQEVPDVQGPVSGADKPVVEEDGGKDVPMLEGSMRQEMDAQGAAALHEMEGATSVGGLVGVRGEKGAGTVSELEGQRTVVAELDGGSVVRGSGG
ncbi:hypothetical protein BDV34DRAFT_232727 [Aspergillus parasiticus]|uniref:Uncharacterized protein n=1 Tax=Aspergillus parasiticus TaxID=5067 RepID=A0A5N6D4F4_ASPPA|nr:hypothetical protein BDV34DRAFT_232727 [Aspergillus parasiticus]